MQLDRQLIDDPPAWLIRRLTQAAWTLAALGVVAFLIVGANRPANPYLVPANGRVSTKALTGFGATFVTVSAGAGLHTPRRPFCMLLATTTAQQDKGLMNQTSLHGFAGMVFQFAHPTQVAFFMKDTVIPLSIAWFRADGTFLSSTSMEPCPPAEFVCPTYSAGATYQLAIEAAKGSLTSLGIGPGSSVQLSGPCAG
ncbi:MAG TPA: DUF192 domain-containing protein [Acidimicrobiales bacterium]|nr:DUF192 domain-containing protein [Acidimicrobiales bacterium]